MLLDIDITYIIIHDRTKFTAWCDRSLYTIHVTPGYSFKLAVVMIQFWFINVLI